MDARGSQSLRGRLVATIALRRPPYSAIRAEFNTGWTAVRDRRVPVSTAGGATRNGSKGCVRGVVGNLEPERSDSSLPAYLLTIEDGSEDDDKKDSGKSAISGVASSGVVSNGSPHGDLGGSGSFARGQCLDRI